MKVGFIYRRIALAALVCLGFGLAGCAEMREGETDVPGRLRSGIEGGGKVGGSPSGVFEPR